MNYDYSNIIEDLVNWYDLNARILPWRSDPTGYHVWISEIMLQQTRVEAVKGYYERFTNRLPNIQSLAEASEETVLKLWEGLGYYSRARNLKKAAEVIVETYGGSLPESYDELLQLPGIGSYTAGAIASIAFGIPVPAVDGNVLRVTKRIAGSFDDITKQKIKTELEQNLRRIMPIERPGDFNQSLMELGARICIPNGRPLCEDCPVMHLCTAFKQDLTAKIPVKPPKKQRRLEDKTILLMEYQSKYLIQKRENKGLLAGLYELPSLEGKWSALKLREYLEDTGFLDFELVPLLEAKHIFSHVEWHMLGYKIVLNQMRDVDSFYRIKEISQAAIWADTIDIKEIHTLPAAFEAYTRFIITEPNDALDAGSIDIN